MPFLRLHRPCFPCLMFVCCVHVFACVRGCTCMDVGEGVGGSPNLILGIILGHLGLIGRISQSNPEVANMACLLASLLWGAPASTFWMEIRIQQPPPPSINVSFLASKLQPSRLHTHGQTLTTGPSPQPISLFLLR